MNRFQESRSFHPTILRLEDRAVPAVIGGFDVARANTGSIDSVDTGILRANLLASFPGSTFVSTNVLTPTYLAGIDVLFICAVYDGTVPITPLTAAEQTALFNYVAGGGGLIAITDNSGQFEPASDSIVNPFGLDATGLINGLAPCTVTNPNHPVTNGPYGVVTTLSYGYPGWYASLGQFAEQLAKLDATATPSLAAIGRNALGAGSGAAVFFSDYEFHDSLYTGSIVTATDNAVAFVGPPRRVHSVVVGDGTAQRSRVTSIDVNFDGRLSLPGDATQAFQLKRQSDGLVINLTAAVTVDASTHVHLTFAGSSIEAGSLADGRYTLTAFAAQINGGRFDGNGDKTPGDNFVLTGTPANGFFRLFGDVDGNGTVNGTDFLAFRLAFLGNNATFDFDGDGTVNGNDFLQFRLRFLQSV